MGKLYHEGRSLYRSRERISASHRKRLEAIEGEKPVGLIRTIRTRLCASVQLTVNGQPKEIPLYELPDEVFEQCMLIPPKHDDASAEMIHIIRDQVTRIRAHDHDLNLLLNFQSVYNVPEVVHIFEEKYLTQQGIAVVKRSEL